MGAPLLCALATQFAPRLRKPGRPGKNLREVRGRLLRGPTFSRETAFPSTSGSPFSRDQEVHFSSPPTFLDFSTAVTSLGHETLLLWAACGYSDHLSSATEPLHAPISPCPEAGVDRCLEALETPLR